jgi:parallel beta-helix repeat protein
VYGQNPQMKTKTTLLTVALGLLMSAIATQAANIQIKSLPFLPITAPGTYVLVSDLTYTAQSGAAITILPNLSGPVVINLNGHTLTGTASIPLTNNSSIGVFIDGNGPSHSTITIENGTITHFNSGVFADSENASGVVGNALSCIDINHIAFSFALSIGGGVDVVFANDVVSSTIRNCTFTESDVGIQSQSAGGNRFTNNTFSNVAEFLLLLPGQNISSPAVLDDSRFEVPAN